MTEKSQRAVQWGLVLFLILVISLLHYQTRTEYRYLHEIYQRVYYIPIVLAAFWFGLRGGVLAASLTTLYYINHIQREWNQFPVYTFNQYTEITLYYTVAVIVGLLVQKEFRQRKKLEITSQELAEAYQKLQQTFEQLKQSDRLAALGKLSAGVAHEIRNPLGSIKGSVEILEKEFPSHHPKREFVEIIKEETARLNSIVAEFLKFARPPRPRIQPASIDELIDSTVILLQKEAQESRVKITGKRDSPNSLVQLDPDQIRQVLLNIMLNGIEAMPQGGTLAVDTSMGRQDQWAVIELSDTGGSAEEVELDHIFDPFFTTKPHGTGLGLSISYQLIQSHRGKITAHKNASGGLTFRIELPVSRAQDLDQMDLHPPPGSLSRKGNS